MNLDELSVLLCNKNSLKFLKKSIPIYKKSKFKELIVVDGNSTDGSLEYLKEQEIKIITDLSKGLSYSRKLAVENANGKIFFIAGPDDVCNHFFLKNSLKNFSALKYDAATVGLKIFNPLTYWDHSLNLWFLYIRGKRTAQVIGTPTFFKKEVFDYISYDPDTIGCDDTDISEKLIKNNFKFGVLGTYVDQINQNNFEDIKKKFILYGISDKNYYLYKNSKINISNLFSTLIHPLKHFFKFSIFLILRKKFSILPFIFIITFYRYSGLFKKN